jgi:putative hydrolase of the HAD superfamily
MSKIRAVVFDCYGTLVDILTDEGKRSIFDHLSLYLRYFGANINSDSLKSLYHVEKERYLNQHGERYPEFDIAAVFKNILQMQELNNPFLVESCCKLFRVVSRERFQLFPDSLEALRKLKSRGYPLAMLSNAQNIFFYEEIDMLGIRQFFNFFTVSSYWGFRKPDHRLFSLTCSLLNVLPEEAVYVGDALDTDVKGAKSIGMQAILIDREQKQNNTDLKPDFYATNLEKAAEWILGDK